MIISPPVTLFRRRMGTHFVISVVPVKDMGRLTITYSTVNLHTLLRRCCGNLLSGFSPNVMVGVKWQFLLKLTLVTAQKKGEVFSS
jgi:hypothetical protein